MTDFAFRSDTGFLKAPRAAHGFDSEAATANAHSRPFAVAGVAWDGCVTNRPGARFGPRAIRTASHMLCDGYHPYFNVSPTEHLLDLGDLPLPNTSLEGMRAAMQPMVADLIRQHHMVWLGGDHSITLPLLREYRKLHGRPLAVVHFDAHCDTWVDHFGEPSGHGTWVYEAIQEGLVDPVNFTQIGIRSSGVREAREYVADQGGVIYTGRQMRSLQTPEQLAVVIESVTTRWKAANCPPLYLSLDIDTLDPSCAPGTGTPEPGGLQSHQLLSLLEDLAALPWVGMDCVEVAPAYDHAELTSFIAAHSVWTYLCGRIAHKGSAT